MKYHYFHRFLTYSVGREANRKVLVSGTKFAALSPVLDPRRRQRQAGSLTGAVHLSKSNAGVLRLAQ